MNSLSNLWTLWFHKPFDTDWDLNSYKQIYSFNTLENGIILMENINKQLVEKCMLFIMKDNIKPIWEVPENNKGGCISYKINVENVNNVWKKLVYSLLGGFLSDNENILNAIKGISISPKKNFCIIKIWISDIEELKNTELYSYFQESIKIENDKIENNKIENDKKKMDPLDIHLICNIEEQNCLFKYHKVIY